MKIDNINKLLIKLDIEGLLELGAPIDEYFSEASEIYHTINKFGKSEINKDVIFIIICIIWQKNFELTQLEMKKRIPKIENFAKILAKDWFIAN